jgi:hypothetical protein
VLTTGVSRPLVVPPVVVVLPRTGASTPPSAVPEFTVTPPITGVTTVELTPTPAPELAPPSADWSNGLVGTTPPTLPSGWIKVSPATWTTPLTGPLPVLEIVGRTLVPEPSPVFALTPTPPAAPPVVALALVAGTLEPLRVEPPPESEAADPVGAVGPL